MGQQPWSRSGASRRRFRLLLLKEGIATEYAFSLPTPQSSYQKRKIEQVYSTVSHIECYIFVA